MVKWVIDDTKQTHTHKNGEVDIEEATKDSKVLEKVYLLEDHLRWRGDPKSVHHDCEGVTRPSSIAVHAQKQTHQQVIQNKAYP